MRRLLLAGLALGLCAVLGGAAPLAARELTTTIDLDYSYEQENLGGDVNATTLFNQKFEVKYETSLTTSHDFIGAVRLELQDAWYTDEAATSRVAPTLEMAAQGAQLAAKLAYEAVINSTDTYHETGDVTTYSTSLTLDLQVTPELWPEVKLKYQRRRDYQDYAKESVVNTFEFTARKDIYGVRLEYNFKREDSDNAMPTRDGSTATVWSSKVTYKEVLWGGTEFELVYEIDESYKDEQDRGVFSGVTSTYDQLFKTRLRNSLDIAPRLRLGLAWEYLFEQDLLALDFDYKLKNKYVLDLRWDAFDWLKITSEARRETELKAAAVDGEADDRQLTEAFKAGFDFTSIPWLLVAGKAEFKSESKVATDSGGSVDKFEEEKYELIARNKIRGFWDFTWAGTSSVQHTDDFLTKRETKVKADLKLKLLDLVVSPGYEVSRANEWEEPFDYRISQQQIRSAKIKFEYQMQLIDMFKATFSHEYAIKVDDQLDEVLNFERRLQFSEDTRLTLALTEIIRELYVDGEIVRKASDTEGDTDPELVELSYALRLSWVIEQLSLLSSIKYNDKGNSFDDVSFNAKAVWKGERLEVTGEYQLDKVLKDATELKEEKRRLNLKLNYMF